MSRVSTLAAALILPLALASCATLPGQMGGGDEQAAMEPHPMANAERDELLDRIDQLEQDLAEMRIEMSRIVPALERLNASVAQQPRQQPAQPPGQQAAAQGMGQETNRVSQGNEPAIAAAVNGADSYSVHLASYRSREAAMEGWSELRRRFNPVLGSLEPRLTEVTLGDRGTFVRLKAGPFTTWGGANEVCDYLRGENWSCAVMDFTGDSGG